MQPKSSQDAAYSLIKDRILKFSLRPNERIRALDIAEELGISRTPVREALSRLEQEGLVVRDSGWGYLVKAMTLAEVVSLFRVREILEVEAAREALGRRNTESSNSLSRLLVASERHWSARKIPEFQKASRGFHAELARLSGNVFIEHMLSTISDRIRILAAMVLQRHAARGAQMIEENRAILAALEAGDAAKLEASIRLHVRRAGEHVLQCLQGDFQCIGLHTIAPLRSTSASELIS